MREDDDLGLVTYVFGAVVVWVFSVLVAGLAISLNWNWWVVPLFGGRDLDLARAIGLAIFLSMFQGLSDTPPGSRRDTILRMLRRNVLPPVLAIALGAAWYAVIGAR
jgi:hypothetical protein